MKKTKKTLLTVGILFLLFGIVPIMGGCFSTAQVREQYIVEPDPKNPYQGTWLSVGKQNMMYVIKGMEATGYVSIQYILGTPAVWSLTATYAIDNTWILSENNNKLNAGGIIYERYLKK